MAIDKQTLTASLSWGINSVTVTLNHEHTRVSLTETFHPDEGAVPWAAFILRLEDEVNEFLWRA